VPKRVNPGRWPARLGAGALVALLGMAGAAPAASAMPAPGLLPAASGRSGACTTADENAVTVIIDYQKLGGGIERYCASNLPKGAVGMDALRAVGVSTAGTTHDGTGFVCRLNGRPSAKESIAVPGDSDYREHCVDTPPSTAYWSYWWAKPGGSWVYSDSGVLSHRVVIGGYEGWSFSNDPEGGFGGRNPAPGVKPVAWPEAPKPSPKPTASKPPGPPPTAPAGPSPKPTPSATPERTSSATPAPRPSKPTKRSKPSSEPARSKPSKSSAASTPSSAASSASPAGDTVEDPAATQATSPAPTPVGSPESVSAAPPAAPTTPSPPPATPSELENSGPGAELAIAGALVVAVAGTAATVALRARRR